MSGGLAYAHNLYSKLCAEFLRCDVADPDRHLAGITAPRFAVVDMERARLGLALGDGR